MLGRDFDQLGTNGSILRSFGDSQDMPFMGPVKVKFLDNNRLGVIDKDRGLHVQNMNGNIEAYIVPQKHELTEVELAREEAKLKKQQLEDEKKEVESVEIESMASSLDEFDTSSLNGHDGDDGEPTNYMDLSIIDLCTIPMSKNIAVCDILTTTVKQIDREDWIIERHLGEERSQYGKPQLKRLSGISSFQLGYKVFYAVSERCNRIQILSEGGKTVREISKSGLLPGEFNDPVGIATYISPFFIEAAKKPTPEPSWYMGSGTKEDLKDDFECLDNKKPGDFLIVQREGSVNVFDGKFITKGGITANIIIVKSVPERDIPSSVQLTMSESSVSMMPWPSVWEAVANCPLLVKDPDPRPYVLIAVIDKGNKRVQVLKYFWMESELFLPAIIPFFVIGGVNNGCNCELVEPKGIAFTPTGEIAVCDDSTKKVTIVSTVSRSIIRIINLSFVTHMENIDNPSVYHNFPLARTREQRARDQAAQDKSYRDYLRNFDRHSKKMKLTKRQFLGDTKISTCDPWVTSIDFSKDGKLAIGFRMGGILILKAYKASDVGTLTNVEYSCFNRILDFCEYGEYEALRECCTCLHNYTSRRRQDWMLKPLGGLRRKYVACAQFQHWAKIPSYIRARLDKKKDTDVNALNSTMKYWVEWLDVKRDVCCLNKWLFPEKNVIKGTRIVKKLKPKKKESLAISSYLRKKEVVEYENKEMISYEDVSTGVLTQTDEKSIICSNLICPHSHDFPVYEPHYMKKYNGRIDLSCVLLSVTKLFGDVFLYKNEIYIRHLFEAFADEMDVEEYHDPMTRQLEVIREISVTSEKSLSLNFFMELMLICEEDYSDAKPLRRQFLFHRMRLRRKFVHSINIPGPAMDVMEHGNLLDVVRSEDDLGCFLHANDIIQYRDGISVPHKKNVNKMYRKVDGAEKEERGVDESGKLQYNKAFIVKADRAESMIDRMFS